ncbi:hypothetical protein LDENG_00154270 [Lucifuga dentata]|nr:hypothetical protein LDENG_00154270 [Lucifuga dentata]
MVCCFAASGPGRLAIIDGSMNSQLYQQILQENVRVSVRELKLKTSGSRSKTMTKHTCHSTKEWLKQKTCNVLERPSQSPDLNPIKMLWKDLKQQFMTGSPPTS